MENEIWYCEYWLLLSKRACQDNNLSKGKQEVKKVIHTLTVRGIIPGSATVPCMVCVLPEEVTPYANIVTV